MKLFLKNFWYYKGVVWKKPNINQKSEKRSASHLELFFDLAFVSSITIFSNYLDYSWVNHDLILWIIFFYYLWNVWFNIILYADRFETSGMRYRLIIWSNMIPCLLMAYGYSESHLIAKHTSNQILEFRGSYILGFVLSRLVLAVIYLDIIVNSAEQNSFVYQNYFFPAIGFIISPIIMYTMYSWNGGFHFNDKDNIGLIVFISVAVVEFVFTSIPILFWSQKLPKLHKTHISERFILFTLITLGETVLASFLSVVHLNELTYVVKSINLNYQYLIWRFSISILLIFGIWWIYTDWVGSIIYSKSKHNKKIVWYSYAHFFLVVGLLFISRGIDGIDTVSALVHSGHSLQDAQAILSDPHVTNVIDIEGGKHIYIYNQMFNFGFSIFFFCIFLIMFNTNLKFANQNYEANNHEWSLWISIITMVLLFLILGFSSAKSHFEFFFSINVYLSIISTFYLIILGIVIWMLYFQRKVIKGIK